VRAERRDLIPAVVHVDGTARVQTLREHQNPGLYAVLREFRALTGLPMLLNTSLNVHGKPIANDVTTILSLLRDSELDCAAIEDCIFGHARERGRQGNHNPEAEARVPAGSCPTPGARRTN
jgi:carbamoyltransferase